MAGTVHDLRPRPPESEKVTINLGPVDLGQIDLLVEEGFYANRTDLIRTAIRAHLDRHADTVRQTVARQSLDLGVRHITRAELEAARDAGEVLHVQVLGLAAIAGDVDAELAAATIGSLRVLGALSAAPEVKAALAGRIR